MLWCFFNQLCLQDLQIWKEIPRCQRIELVLLEGVTRTQVWHQAWDLCKTNIIFLIGDGRVTELINLVVLQLLGTLYINKSHIKYKIFNICTRALGLTLILLRSFCRWGFAQTSLQKFMVLRSMHFCLNGVPPYFGTLATNHWVELVCTIITMQRTL